MGLRGAWHLASPPERQLLVLGHPKQQGRVSQACPGAGMFKSQMEAPQLRTVVAVIPDWSSSSENRELACLGTSHHTLGSVGSLNPSQGTQKSEGWEWTDSALLHLGVYLFYTSGIYCFFFKFYLFI